MTPAMYTVYETGAAQVDYQGYDFFDPTTGDYIAFLGFDLQGRPVYNYLLNDGLNGVITRHTHDLYYHA